MGGLTVACVALALACLGLLARAIWLERRIEKLTRMVDGYNSGTEDMLEQFRKAGAPVEELCVSGGTTRSPLFMQIHADISGIPMKITSDYSVALGSAVCAAHAAGFYPSVPTAVEQMVRPAGTVLPDPARHEAYKPVVERYRGLYAALRPWVHQN